MARTDIMTFFAGVAALALASAMPVGAQAAPKQEYVRDLSELLSIPSVSSNRAENDKAIEWMKAFLEKRGV